MGCHALLQGIFPTQGSNPCVSCIADRFFTAEPPEKHNIPLHISKSVLRVRLTLTRVATLNGFQGGFLMPQAWRSCSTRSSSGVHAAGLTAGIVLSDLSMASRSVPFPKNHRGLSDVLFRGRPELKGWGGFWCLFFLEP